MTARKGRGPRGGNRRPSGQRTTDPAKDSRPVVGRQAEERASQADREWFEARYWRNHRFRAAEPAELWGGTPYVIVRQVRPGFRCRLGVVLCGGTDAEAMMQAPEAVLAILFDKLARGQPASVGEAVASALRSGGRS